jgi:nitrogenase-stabilizing/protective protein
MMEESEFLEEMQDLVSAEDFLEYFEIPFDETVVKVNRLHILQRFHNYLAAAAMPEDEAGQKAIYINSLAQAYNDFVNSDAATEKVLKIYQRQSGTSFVNFNQIGREV